MNSNNEDEIELKVDWDKIFMSQALLMALKSKDRRTKIGALCVGKGHELVSGGFNGIPRGCSEKEERQVKPLKPYWYVHAERNAIYNAARIGAKLQDTIMYCNVYPCPDCAQGIIQVGIKEIIIYRNPNTMGEELKETSGISHEMLAEAGVKIRNFNDVISKIYTVYDGIRYEL